MITIDTGTALSPVQELVPGWFVDQYATIPDDARIAHDYGYHLIGAMRNPKKLETVRGHVLAQWRFIAVLAELHPGVFDELLCAYAERALAFE